MVGEAGDLIDYLAIRLPPSENVPSGLAQRALHRVRRATCELRDLPRTAVRPDTGLDYLFRDFRQSDVALLQRIGNERRPALRAERSCVRNETRDVAGSFDAPNSVLRAVKACAVRAEE
jgi:hypothetical protein